MANVYIRSGAAGAGTGADWANAFTTVAAALTAKAAGDNFWVSEDHAETAASAKTLTSPGTAAAPCTIMCVNHSGTVPPVSADLRTTATVTTTGANAITIAAGYAYWYGIIFNCGTGTTSAALSIGAGNEEHYFRNCALNKLTTLTASQAAIFVGGNTANVDSRITFDNTTVKFGNTGDGIRVRFTIFRWIDTASAIQGATLPTTLMNAIGGGPHRLIGVDLSALGSGKTLINPQGSTASNAVWLLQDCKLGASVTVASTPTGKSALVTMIRCDSGATNYRHEQYSYHGTQTVETTIVRTGGATDGTTPIAWKIVTTANAKWIAPFESIPIAIWNDTTGANVTVTVYGIWGGGAVPNNDDVWIEIGYLGDSSTPQATLNRSNTKANFLATNAGQTSDSSTWGGSTTAFKMVATLSSPQPAQRGPMYVVVKAAAASSTIYIDPKVVLS
jgi:hypothetical protein